MLGMDGIPLPIGRPGRIKSMMDAIQISANTICLLAYTFIGRALRQARRGTVLTAETEEPNNIHQCLLTQR